MTPKLSVHPKGTPTAGGERSSRAASAGRAVAASKGTASFAKVLSLNEADLRPAEARLRARAQASTAHVGEWIAAALQGGAAMIPRLDPHAERVEPARNVNHGQRLARLPTSGRSSVGPKRTLRGARQTTEAAPLAAAPVPAQGTGDPPTQGTRATGPTERAKLHAGAAKREAFERTLEIDEAPRIDWGLVDPLGRSGAGPGERRVGSGHAGSMPRADAGPMRSDAPPSAANHPGPARPKDPDGAARAAGVDPAPQSPRGEAAESTTSPGRAVEEHHASPLAARDANASSRNASPVVERVDALSGAGVSASSASQTAATHAAPSAQPPAPAAQLAEAVAARLPEAPIRFEVTVTPESLGPVDVQLRLRGGAVEVSLVAQSADAQEVLAAGFAELGDTLSRMGIDLAGADVTTRDDGQRRTFGETRDPHSDSQEQPRRAAEEDATTSSQRGNPNEQGSGVETSAVRPGARARGRVDLHA
jgi:flagellar hook-length control protein FliK